MGVSCLQAPYPQDLPPGPVLLRTMGWPKPGPGSCFSPRPPGIIWFFSGSFAEEAKARVENLLGIRSLDLMDFTG